MSRRLKVLISAYACSPYQGSEPGVGWGFVSSLASLHDLWVIVEEEKFREDIQRYLLDHPELVDHVHFHFLRKKRNRLLRKLWPPSYYWYYRRWHQDALVLAKKLHREVGFDLAHQLTMVGYREPGYLWQLGIPFVWGPIGGMGFFPWQFLSSMGWYGALYYLGYNIYNMLQMNFAQRPRSAAKAAGVGLIVATRENQLGAERYWGCASTLLSEVGIPKISLKTPRQRLPSEPLRIVWAGLHIPRKALNLALQALGSLPIGCKWEFHVLGTGPRSEAWKRLAADLHIGNSCHFHGWLSREETMEIMQTCHVMLITSLRDLTSTVTLEAISLGLPLICLDHCGFSDVVDDKCGIKVPVLGPKEVVRGIATVVARMENDETLRMKMAEGAFRRASDFYWPKKVQVVDGIYRRVIDQRGKCSRENNVCS